MYSCCSGKNATQRRRARENPEKDTWKRARRMTTVTDPPVLEGTVSDVTLATPRVGMTAGWLNDSNVEALWRAAIPPMDDPSGGINAARFFGAVEALVTSLDLIRGMGVAKSAMLDNLNISRVHFPASLPEATLQQIIIQEVTARPSRVVLADQASATHQLMWLLRGISLVTELMANMIANPTATLSTCVREAYGRSLKPYHPKALQYTIWMLAGSAGKRAKFEQALGDASVIERLRVLMPHVALVVGPVQTQIDAILNDVPQ